MKRERKKEILPPKKASSKNETSKNTHTKETSSKQTQQSYFGILTLIGLIIVIGIFAFKKYLTGEYLFFFKDIGSDSINQNYPAIVHKLQLLKEGFFSKWSFYKGVGDEYITGIPTEPYGFLRLMTDYAGGNISGANFFIVGRFIRIFIFNFLFGGMIAYFYFRTLSLKKFSSLIGALLIVFSGYMVAGAGWGFSSHVFKAVFLLFAFEQLYLKKRWFFFPFAVIWLSSNPYDLYLYTAFLFLYSLFRFFSEENRVSNYLKLAGKMIVLGFVGIMMNFANLLKAFMKMYNSPRVAGDASYSNMLSSGQDIVEHGNLGATTVLRFFSSDILGSGSHFQGWFNYLEAPLFYIGLLSLLLFPQIFIHLTKRKKIIFGSFLGFWLLTLFVPYLRYFLLAFTGDYFRYGFDFFIPFTLLLFAVLSLNEIDKTLKINLPLLVGSFVVLIVLLFFPYASIPEKALQSNIRTSAAIFLILYAVLIYAFSKIKYKKTAQYALVILTVIELSYFSYHSYSDRVPLTKTEFNKDKAGYADGTIKAVNYIKSIDKTPFYRTEKDYQSGNAEHGSLNDALAQGYYGTTSYSSFNKLSYVDFLEKTGLIMKGDETATRWITGFRAYPLLQTFGNVKYYLSKSEKPEFMKFGFDSLAKVDGITILKNRYYLPFGYTYDTYISENDFEKLITYQISVQSLNTIYQDLSRTTEADKLNFILENLKPLLTREFPNYASFSDAVINNIGKENEKYVSAIAKYSVNNFKNQIALLNAFVTDKDIQSKEINAFHKLTLNDSTVLVSGDKFNFEMYKTLTDKLKKDTFQITSFKQSEITGKITLPETKMLFFTIPYDQGWKIKVDGNNKKLLNVNIGFTGIILPKGEHNIKLYYVPQYYKTANIITLISVILFWAFAIIYFFKKRNSKKEAHLE